MNAAVRPESYQIDGMSRLLRKWGSCCESLRHWNAYPSSDPTYRSVFGGSSVGGRLPIPEMPSDVVRINRHIMRLPDVESNAVTIWYAYTLNPMGNAYWTPAQKAMVLSISEHTLRRQVRNGRERLIFEAGYLL